MSVFLSWSFGVSSLFFFCTLTRQRSLTVCICPTLNGKRDLWGKRELNKGNGEMMGMIWKTNNVILCSRGWDYYYYCYFYFYPFWLCMMLRLCGRICVTLYVCLHCEEHYFEFTYLVTVNAEFPQWEVLGAQCALCMTPHAFLFFYLICQVLSLSLSLLYFCDSSKELHSTFEQEWVTTKL